MTQKTKTDLKDAIFGHMPLIDLQLTVSETSLGSRAISAAMIFVNECVLDIEGDSKDNFAEKPWFAYIYDQIDEWYREHYGAAYTRDHAATSCGVLLVREMPVELKVPLTKGRVEVPGETAWLEFPITVADEERPLEWLVNGPDVNKLPPDELATLSKDGVGVASALRAIHYNLIGIEPDDPVVEGLTKGITAECESAARNFLRNDSHGRGAALWSLQMAVERILKAYSQHKTGSFREIHNLFELYDDVASLGLIANRELLKAIPRDKDVIADRYGLRGIPTLYETYNAYKATVTFIGEASSCFARKLSFGGGAILLKKAPWIRPMIKRDGE